MDISYIVREGDGTVNYNKSAAAYAVALRDWVQANEIAPELLDKAIDSVFDENKSTDPSKPTRISKTGLVTLAVTRLKLNANQLGTVTERLNKFVMKNPRFLTHKGKGGGVERLARAGEPIPEMKVEESKTA